MSTPAENSRELTFDETLFGESSLAELEADLRSIEQLENIAIYGRLEIGNIVRPDGIYLNKSVRTFSEEDPIEELMRLATWKRDVLLAIAKKGKHPESGIQGIDPKSASPEFELEEEIIIVEEEPA